MLIVFLSLMMGVYFHQIFPFSLILLPTIFLPIKYYKIAILFFVIGTFVFVPSANISGFREVYGTVVSSNGNTLVVKTIKVDDTHLSQKIIVAFSDKIYKTYFDLGEEVYFKGKIKQLSSVYYTKISTKDIGFLPPNDLFYRLKYYYLSKIETLRNKDIVASILLGYRSFNSNINRLLKDSGFSPIFAISGLHIGLISVVIYFLFNFMGLLWRRIATIAFLVLYIFLIGFPLSASRAVAMIVLFLTLSLFDLPTDSKTTISVVGILFILSDPSNVYDAGFLMSFFGAVALILSPKNKFLPLIYLFLFVSPLTSFFFSKIFLFSFFFQSIVVIPIITIFMIVGIWFLFLPLQIFLPALDRISDLIYLFMNIGAKMPAINFKIPLNVLIVYYVLLLGIAIYIDNKFSVSKNALLM